ncbi:unnamed protein product, partial [Timema podura]|nr:unnamed protein product [Timema podura]
KHKFGSNIGWPLTGGRVNLSSNLKHYKEDESDSSDYEEKAVKTEMKFYDSSLGVMDSRPDHFIVDVKSQVFG